MLGDQAPLTASSVFRSLHLVGQRLKKHRRGSAEKDAEDALRELDEVLLAIRHQNSDSLSAHSHVTEAQALMAKAAVAKHAARPVDEADSYLRAAGIWFSVEREKYELNFPTTDEALSKAVLCAGMACHVLLSVPPSKAANPIPPRLQSNAHQPMHPYAFHCHTICARVATQLQNFCCFEMAADYWEIAALLVSMEEADAGDAGDARLRKANKEGITPPFSSNESVVSGGGGGASHAPWSAAGSHSTAGSPSPSLMSSVTHAVATRFKDAASASSFAAEPRQPGMSNASFTSGSFSLQQHRAAQAAASGSQQQQQQQQQQDLQPQSVHHRAGTSGASASASGATGVSAVPASSRGAGAMRTRVYPGCHLAFANAVLQAAKLACFVKDYDRALRCLDACVTQIAAWQQDAAPQHVLAQLEKLRAIVDGRSSSTEQHPVDDGKTTTRAADDEAPVPGSQEVAAAADLGMEESLTFAAVAGSASAVAPLTSEALEAVTAAPPPQNAAASRANAPGVGKEKARTVPSHSGSGAPNPAGSATAGAGRGSGAHEESSSPSQASPPPLQPLQNGDDRAIPPAARAPATNPALFSTARVQSEERFAAALVAMETHLVQAHTLRFFVHMLQRHTPPVSALSEVEALAVLARVYRQQEQRTRHLAQRNAEAAQVLASDAIAHAADKGRYSQGLRRALRPVSACSYNDMEREDLLRRAALAGDQEPLRQTKQVLPNRAQPTARLVPTAAPGAGPLLFMLQQQRRRHHHHHPHQRADHPAPSNRGDAGADAMAVSKTPLQFDKAPYSWLLDQLAGTLRLMLGAFSEYATSPSPNTHVHQFRALLADFNRLAARLGVRCREMSVMAQRALETLVTNPFAAIAPTEQELAPRKAT